MDRRPDDPLEAVAGDAMSTPANPPAFPCRIVTHIDGDGVPHAEPHSGMSLRDWFAGQALRGGADAICDQLEIGATAVAEQHCARHARAAYMLADAMLKAREAQ